MMGTLRFRFERVGRVRFTSHLDMLRTFQRAFRRAGIPLAYSQGFNPHPEFVIGLPLGVGTTSEAEFAELGMAEEMAPEVFVEKLNEALPEGLKVLAAAYRQNRDNIMASIAELTCVIHLELDGPGDLKVAVDKLMDSSEILIDKTTKKGTRQVDIRPMIRSARALDESRVELCCDAGSKSNLSPELFVEALKRELPEIGYAWVHRTRVRLEKNGGLVEPLDEEALV